MMEQQELAAIREKFSQARLLKNRYTSKIAEKLNLAEGQIIAAYVGCSDEIDLSAVRLNSQWPEIISAVETLGQVSALTRNASCVHKKTGTYRHISLYEGNIGLVLDSAIDLRIFYKQWAHGFAVTEVGQGGVKKSLQFFNAAGVAIHKILLGEKSNVNAYDELVKKFASDNQTAGMMPEVIKAEKNKADSEVDVAGFRKAWGELKDVHDFFALLRQFGISRLQGIRLADPNFKQEVGANSIYQMLTMASRDLVPIMVFAGNGGVIQIHTGCVNEVSSDNAWLRINDGNFEFCLKESQISSAWVVIRPSVDGPVSSIEIFDPQGELIASFFGERKPGIPQKQDWKLLLENLLRESVFCAQ